MRLADKVNGALNGFSTVAKGFLLLAAIVIPTASASFAAGGYLASRGIEDSIELHIADPTLHVVTRDKLERIDRRLCLLMQANSLQDADCP